MKTINCAECNVLYQYEPAKGYPDRRKYCANCSEKKQATWEAKDSNKPVEMSEQVYKTLNDVDVVDMTQTVSSNDKPKKSYELTDGNIRIGALTCAIELTKRDSCDRDVMNLAEEFEEYIRNGK